MEVLPGVLKEEKLKVDRTNEANLLYHKGIKVAKLVEDAMSRKSAFEILHALIYIGHYSWIMPLLDVDSAEARKAMFPSDWPTMFLNAAVHTLEDLPKETGEVLDSLISDPTLNAQLDTWYREFAGTFRITRNAMKQLAIESLPPLTKTLQNLCDKFTLTSSVDEARAMAELDADLVASRTAAVERLNNLCSGLSTCGALLAPLCEWDRQSTMIAIGALSV